MELLPVHGQIACALVLVAALTAAPLVATPHDSGPACRLVTLADAGLQPGFAALGERSQAACTRVALP